MAREDESVIRQMHRPDGVLFKGGTIAQPMWHPGWRSHGTFLVEKDVRCREDFSWHRKRRKRIERETLAAFGGRFEHSRVMTPIPCQTLEFAFPDAAKHGHTFARETQREEPTPFSAKLYPFDLAR